MTCEARTRKTWNDPAAQSRNQYRTPRRFTTAFLTCEPCARVPPPTSIWSWAIPKRRSKWWKTPTRCILDEDALGGLNAFTTTPMLVAVLVRVGDINGALAIVQKMQKAADKKPDAMFSTNPDIAWLTWATVCTLEGRTVRVEGQLEKAENARVKAVLCAGVAAALLELQHKPRGKRR